MLAELDVVVFLKSNDDLDTTAQRVFSVLKSRPQRVEAESAEGSASYTAEGMGFNAVFYANNADMLDPEFEEYDYGLEITSNYWCVAMDTLEMEAPLSEYFARLLAFELGVETATEILVETTEESEIFEIRAYARNPQYRLDQSPTTPKVFVAETRQVEETFDDEDEWDEDETEMGGGEPPA